MIKSEHSHRDKLIFLLSFTLVISVMNSTMFNMAVPTITRDFHLKPSQAGWIITGYIVVYAIGTVMYGKLADKYKLMNLLTFGLSLFAVGSIVGFLAINFEITVLGRMLQAAGASVMPASSLIIPSRYFSPESRGRALGIVSAGTALGTAIGPIVAGVVISFISWRYLFIISLLSIITLPLFRKYLKEEVQHNETKTDILGAIFLAGTISLSLLAITQRSVWFASFGLMMFVLFIWRIRKAREPFINITVFKNKNYSLAILVSGLSTGIGFGIPYLTPLLLQNVNGISPFMSGLIMFPGALLAASLGKQGGRIADYKGNRFLTYTALTCFFIGYSLLSIFSGLSPYVIMFVLLFACIGQTFTQIALANTVSSSLPKEQSGIGMGIFMMTNFIAGAVATTFISIAVERKADVMQLNPLLIDSNGVTYSNIYTSLAILILLIIVLYANSFRKSSSGSLKKQLDRVI
ncbi:MFS transporter [Robertmurraya korlensis]|uniref:MFS transporter n=1 Tax=Robertmurraya korlensis TaxID=519977 RepID=UPI000AF8A9C7|nr:MFS transporter [Robertmurraya korlensis]